MNPEQDQQEYNSFIKESVKSGIYFKDAFDWYIFRYVNPVCERTILFFIAIFGVLISYILFLIIENSLPMVEKAPVIIRAKDTSLYFSVIKALQEGKDIRTIDEAVAKHLLITYLKEREEYNFRKGDIEVLNNKFNRIKNNSSVQEYKNFQAFMSRENPSSPIQNFGKNAGREIKIISVSFKRMQVSNLIDKAKDFMSVEIPSEVEIRYNATISINNQISNSQKYLTKITFKFSSIDPKDVKKELKFTVVDYKTYKIK